MHSIIDNEMHFCFFGGKVICDPGTKLGKGLTIEAAKELNLPIGLPVAASLIDAHAGGLGT